MGSLRVSVLLAKPCGVVMSAAARHAALIGFLVGQGKTADEIKHETGASSRAAVYKACQRYRIKLGNKPGGRRSVVVPLSFGPQETLKREAALRGMSADELTTTILETVCSDSLFSALLDR